MSKPYIDIISYIKATIIAIASTPSKGGYHPERAHASPKRATVYKKKKAAPTTDARL